MHFTAKITIIFSTFHLSYCIISINQNSELVTKLSHVVHSILDSPSGFGENKFLGIFAVNETLESNDFLSEFLATQKVGVKILNKIPRGNMFQYIFSDTIVLTSYVNETLVHIIQALFDKQFLWRRDHRFTLVVTEDVEECMDLFKENIKLLWKNNGLINFVVLYKLKQSQKINLINYNPYTDKFKVYDSSTSLSKRVVFPKKFTNLYGYKFNLSFCIAPPYIYRKSWKTPGLAGLDYDFSMTFLRHLNATFETIEFYTYADALKELDWSDGRADMMANGALMIERTLHHTAFPHAFLNLIVVVNKAPPLPALEDTLQVFDVYTWIAVIAFWVLVYGAKKWWPTLFPSNILAEGDAVMALKLIAVFYILFNMLFIQIFQSWITTFLTLPDSRKEIDTIEDLIESNISIYSVDVWKEYVSSKLSNQYIFYSGQDLRLPTPGMGSIVTEDFATILYNFPKTSKLWMGRYHLVKEPAGTGYMIFHLRPNSPYRNVLRSTLLRALAYGYYSKDWGAKTEHKYVSREPRASKLQFEHLEGVFWCCGLCLIFSVVLFVGEVAWFHYVAYNLRVYEFVE